jgi:protocatechuate 3,4-dioxygenase beta subunit
MQNDDHARGRVLSRREVLALLGATGLVVAGRPLSAAERWIGAKPEEAAPSHGCVVRPEQTEGPYFVDQRLQRSDIRADSADGRVRPGAALALTFNVSRLASADCKPLAGALVDVWHCDAIGVYSGVEDPSFDTRGSNALRGYQITDAAGSARFTTIYPGWYSGRTVHIHFMIRSAPDVRPGFNFTSQLYFDDDLTDRVHAQEPYASKGMRHARNTRDGIFRRGGKDLMLAVTSEKDAYRAAFDIALEMDPDGAPRT